jgi:bla regulator protein blaR1
VIAALIVCSMIVDFVFGFAALGVEKLLCTLGAPRRGVWLSTLWVSVTFTLISYWIMHVSGAQLFVQSDDSLWYAPGRMPEQIWRLLAPFAWPSVNRILIESWISACALFVALNVWRAIWLVRASRTWKRTVLESTPVWISDHIGPAVVGLHRIVVPAWLLTADSQIRALTIIHEQEHVKRRDALLLLAGFLLVGVMPWNPALNWQLRRLRFAIEVDCDARIVRSRQGCDRSAYIEALTWLWQKRYGRANFPRDRRSDVQERIRILRAV